MLMTSRPAQAQERPSSQQPPRTSLVRTQRIQRGSARALRTTARIDRYVNDLAAQVERRWRAVHYDSSAFATIATETLGAQPAHGEIAPLELLHWAARTDALPPQDAPGNRFGEPAIRLFDDGRFFIQVLFWFDSTTSIHQHSFSGAFEVLAGSSIHSRYDFELGERLNEHLQLGTLTLREIELLEQGAVRSISTGRNFIHSLFHLDHPSVSFLVRTHNDVESGPLYTYARPGVAFDSFHVTPRTKLLNEVLIAANAMGASAFDTLLPEVFQTADAEAAFHLLTSYRQMIGVDDWPALPSQLERVIGRRSSTWHATVSAALVEQARQQRIVDCRKHVTDHELRFCLALLLNAQCRSDVYGLVRARFPQREPAELVSEWIGRLWDTEIPGDAGEMTNPLLLGCDPSVKAPALDVLSRLLAGQADEGIVDGMSSFRGVSQVCELWRGHSFLQPLFAPSRAGAAR